VYCPAKNVGILINSVVADKLRVLQVTPEIGFVEALVGVGEKKNPGLTYV
jgi:hypothetical protein